MPFTDNTESMAPSNQTLINYGITILSIENFFKKIVYNPLSKKELNKSSIESIEFFLLQFEEEKKNYFNNLLKVKTESHFFKFFEKILKFLLSKKGRKISLTNQAGFLLHKA